MEWERAVPDDVLITPPVKKEEGISISSLSDALCGGQGHLPTVRLGIVCMTKKPQGFEYWLRYHVEALRVERFYLRVEDTPELEPLLLSPPWSDICRSTFHTNTVRCWSGQTERQSAHVAHAVSKACTDGLTHLLHLDDDELLYLPSGLRALQREFGRAPSGIVNLHALTLEALVPRDDEALTLDEFDSTDASRCPFTRCRMFRHVRMSYAAYGGSPVAAGKSFGLLACPTLQFNSPHHFFTSRFGGPSAGYMGGSLLLGSHLAVVLHFESCSYVRWRLKFTEYAKRHEQIKAEREAKEAKAEAEAAEAEAAAEAAAVEAMAQGKSAGRALAAAASAKRKPKDPDDLKPKPKDPTFFFYQQSMYACLRKLRAEEESARCPGSVVYPQRIRMAEDECRDLWARRKLEPNELRAMQTGRTARVVPDYGVTLIPPCFDHSSGEVELPPGHFDGLTRSGAKYCAATAAPAGAAASTGAEPSAAPQQGQPPETWAALVARAGLPPGVAERLAAASTTSRSDHIAATGDLSPALMTPTTASRTELDSLARRAGLPMGQRLRLKTAIPEAFSTDMQSL